MRRALFLFTACLFCVESASAAPVVRPEFSSVFQIDLISGTFTAPFTQLAFGADGKLYASTWGSGVWRFDYDPSGNLSNGVQCTSYSSLGVGFHDSGVHGLCMYLTLRNGTLGEIRRLTDNDADGIWGEAGETDVALVDNIPVSLHQVDQLQIRDGALYVGIGNRTNDGADESSYSGTISWIQDLDGVASTTNAAAFVGLDFFTDPTPYTSTATDKLIVHSGTTRNPFGIAFDGDGSLWMTNNQIDWAPVAQDEFFRTFPFADYGYPASNSGVDWRTHASTLGAGFFAGPNLVSSLTVPTPDLGYDPDDPTPGLPPGGLGPHSSADGFDFYDGTALPLRFHKDAFIVRASTSDTSFTHLPETYQDLVAVDRNTGEVIQIADDFNRPLDALCDANGNVLVAEVGQSPGRVYRVSALSPIAAPHAFMWDTDSDGNWTDRLSWDSAVPTVAERMFPHAWGIASYAVTIDRSTASPNVTVDRDILVTSLTLGDQLTISSDERLTVTSDWDQTSGSTLFVNLTGTTHNAIAAQGIATLNGRLELAATQGFLPQMGQEFTILTYGSVSGTFAEVVATGFDVSVQYGVTDLVATVTDVATTTPLLSSGAALQLTQNPIPAGKPLEILFRTSSPSVPARVTLYDVTGRRIGSIAEGLFPTGQHRAGFAKRASLTAGVYFIRYEHGDLRANRQVVLLK